MTRETTVLLAGATGAVGRAALGLLGARGVRVRTLSRDPGRAAAIAGAIPGGVDVRIADARRPAALRGALDGVDVVVSCLGASVSLGLRGRAGYFHVDVPAHEHLVAEARAAGVRRLVYLSVFAAPGYDHTRYVRAHLEVESRIRGAGIDSVVVRPTGVFTALGDFLAMARWGIASLPGDGQARTNPVHPIDVAEALVDAIDGGPEVVEIGGPEVLRRDDLVGLAFAALGKRARIAHVPPAIFKASAWVMRPLHPRLGELLEFAVAVSTSDGVAPAAGRRRLEPWFRDLAQESGR